MVFSAEALRVLASLMEKEMVTPEAYPLSTNGLTAASNQRSSRDPVMELGEEEVRSALEVLEANGLVAARDHARVRKYEHRIRTVLNLRRDETALLCLLLLRGPQTPGELRSRSERMFAFNDVSQLQAALERLATREEALVVQLPRQPGSRESRWTHLLGGPPPEVVDGSVAYAGPTTGAYASDISEKIASLENRLQILEVRLRALELGRGESS